HGQALHQRGLAPRGRPGGADLRRRRVLQAVPGRAALPRPAHPRDLRGHVRDPARGHRPRRRRRGGGSGVTVPAHPRPDAPAGRRIAVSPPLGSRAGELGRALAGLGADLTGADPAVHVADLAEQSTVDGLLAAVFAAARAAYPADLVAVATTPAGAD